MLVRGCAPAHLRVLPISVRLAGAPMTGARSHGVVTRSIRTVMAVSSQPMLVLTRRTNQSIVIGPDVTITVVEIRGEQVRLGISAPRHVTVHREEVLEQIRDQNRKAAELSGDDAVLLPRRAPQNARTTKR